MADNQPYDNALIADPVRLDLRSPLIRAAEDTAFVRLVEVAIRDQIAALTNGPECA